MRPRLYVRAHELHFLRCKHDLFFLCLLLYFDLLCLLLRLNLWYLGIFFENARNLFKDGLLLRLSFLCLPDSLAETPLLEQILVKISLLDVEFSTVKNFLKCEFRVFLHLGNERFLLLEFFGNHSVSILLRPEYVRIALAICKQGFIEMSQICICLRHILRCNLSHNQLVLGCLVFAYLANFRQRFSLHCTVFAVLRQLFSHHFILALDFFKLSSEHGVFALKSNHARLQVC